MDVDRDAAAPASSEREILVGVDVGGTKIAALAVGAGDVELGRTVRPVETDPAADFVRVLLESIRATVDAVPGGLAGVRAVGIAIPGRVHPGSGHVRQAVNLAWVDEAVGPRVSEALGRPCVVENDVRAAALGIQRHGGTLASPDMAYLNIGTGVAAGVVLGARLHRGRLGMAGEIGHIVLDPSGGMCVCGLRGCVEALVAGPAIARLAESTVPRPVLDAFGGAGLPVVAALYAAAVAGDPAARSVVETVSGVIARVVHGLVMAYDVDRVVLGGGVSKVGAPFLDGILRELDGLREHSALAREMLGPDLLRLVPAGFEAGCWGAIGLADDAARASSVGAAA